MAFVVVYDACVLYPAPVRDLLLRIGLAGIVRARWTDEILDECFRNVTKDRPDLDPLRLERTRRLMVKAVPDCLVTGYARLADGVALPDEGDRHVLAAAIRCGVQAIVTFNTDDFPVESVAPFGIETKHPDDFVLESMELRPGSVAQIIQQQAEALKAPPMSIGELLDMLRTCGLEQSVARLRGLFDGAS